MSQQFTAITKLLTIFLFSFLSIVIWGKILSPSLLRRFDLGSVIGFGKLESENYTLLLFIIIQEKYYEKIIPIYNLPVNASINISEVGICPGYASGVKLVL